MRSGVHHAEVDERRSKPGADPDSELAGGGQCGQKEIGLSSPRSALRGSRYRRGRYHR
jgi:hypothetical protein